MRLAWRRSGNTKKKRQKRRSKNRALVRARRRARHKGQKGRTFVNTKKQDTHNNTTCGVANSNDTEIPKNRKHAQQIIQSSVPGLNEIDMGTSEREIMCGRDGECVRKTEVLKQSSLQSITATPCRQIRYTPSLRYIASLQRWPLNDIHPNITQQS